MRRWLVRVLISLDQLANAVFGGDPDETISSRAGKAARRYEAWGEALCDGLDLLDENHCEEAIEEDEGRPAPSHMKTGSGPRKKTPARPRRR